MKTVKLSFLFLIFCITTNTAVFSAPKRKERATTSSTKTFRGTLKNNNFSVQTSSITTSSTNEVMSCGKSASLTNTIAKRKCAIAYSEALKTYCQTYPCTSKAKVEFSFSFALPNLSSISTEINNTNCNGENLDKFCSPFTTDLINNLWDLYSEQTIRERKNCNFAKAKYSAAQDCFIYIQSERNNSVGNIFDAKKITKLDIGIDNKCGREAIINKYKSISIDDWTQLDEQTFFKGSKVNSNGLLEDTETYQGKKELSSTIASLFANIGDNTWNLTSQIGKLADLNLDTKSSTYPRELVVIANSFITEGETACGKNFKVDMEDTSFEIKDKRSSLEKEIAKKGALKGLFDFTLDNTVGVIAGNEKSTHIKEQGIIGLIKEAKENSNKKDEKKDIYNTKSKKDLENLDILLTSCDSTTPENYNTITTKIYEILNNILSALTEMEIKPNDNEDVIKIKTAQFNNHNENIKKVINKILEFKRNTNETISITNSNINTLKNVITTLLKTKFTCPNGTFEIEKKEEKNINFNFSFNEKNDNIIDELINSLEKSTEATRNEISKELNDTVTNLDNIKNIIIQLEKITNTNPNKDK